MSLTQKDAFMPRHYFVICVIGLVLFSYIYYAAGWVKEFAPLEVMQLAIRSIWHTWVYLRYGWVTNLVLYGGFIVFCQCWLRDPEPDSGFFVLLFGISLTPWSLATIDFFANSLGNKIGHHPLF